jgi:L-ascorbate metabolism protein UlaG (beta-lactamase superfamily)
VYNADGWRLKAKEATMEHPAERPALAAQVRALAVPPGHLAVWALGQQGYLLKGGAHAVIIDPYLTDHIEQTGGPPRQVPIPAGPGELDMVTVACATHHHADHCDPYTLIPLLAAAPQARLVTSYTGRDLLAAEGVDPGRITVPPIDMPVDYGDGLTITAIPSAHYTFEPDTGGNPAFLGFIITLNGVTLYHSGDTIIYDGLVERLRRQPLDLACLPINGRDWFREQRGLVGNMDYREAAELAATVGARVLLAGHNDMFAGNRINPAYLLDYLSRQYPRQRVHFLQAGELYYYAA